MTRLSQLVTALGASEKRKGSVQKSTESAYRSSQQSDVTENLGRVAGSASKPDKVVQES